jgi:signal transduction histidine kinase
MTRRLVATYLTLTVLVLVGLEIPLGVQFARNERSDLTSKVERDAVTVASLSEDTLEEQANANRPALAALARRYRADTGGRIVIVSRAGRAIVDSSASAPVGRSFATRPEIERALAGRVATGERYSRTLGTNLLYVAVPVASGGVVYGAVRITYPTSAVDSRIRRYWLGLAGIAAVVLTAAAFACVALARWMSRPLRELEQAAEAAGAGDLAVRASEEGPPEVRHVAAAFNDMVARLGALMRSQETFVADASHQLRTPLTALRLRLENLEQDVPDERRSELRRAEAETKRVTSLVDGLLTLARAESGQPATGPVDVCAAVAERVEVWRPYADERAVTLITAVTAGLAARTAVDRLEQVLDNLFANALDVAPTGSAITVSAAPDDGWIELHVMDRGRGLSRADRERAFNRFWRGSGDGEGSGSGLGLAIVRRLVRADGGEVELREAVGGGVDAVVRLRAA